MSCSSDSNSGGNRTSFAPLKTRPRFRTSRRQKRAEQTGGTLRWIQPGIVGVLDQAHDASVRDSHAFGLASRTRSVNDVGQIFSRGGLVRSVIRPPWTQSSQGQSRALEREYRRAEPVRVRRGEQERCAWNPGSSSATAHRETEDLKGHTPPLLSGSRAAQPALLANAQRTGQLPPPPVPPWRREIERVDWPGDLIDRK